MKRIFSIAIVLIMLCSMLAVPAFAAGNGSMSMGSASGNRGDTVTLSVNLNSNPGLVTMTIRVSYDTSVLQLTNVSNPGLLVGAQLNTSYGSPYTISWVDGATTTNNTKTGTIATFTFKILDNAKIGDSTVALQFVDSYDTDYNENSFTATSGKVTVTCKHSYGSWTKVNDTTHKRTCSICQKDETANHNWNGGSITKPASCKETGVKTYTCTACNATKTETIAKTTDHKYGSWTKVNDTTHKHTCSVCSKEETANHTWNSGSVTKPASCKETGVKTYTCTACNATKTESIAKTTTHSYGNWTKVNDTTHKHTCSVCSKEETANHTWNSGTVTKKATCKEDGVKTYTCTACNATKTESIAKLTTHTYDHACDTDCNVCGATRTITHNYKTSWSKDKTNHWHECSVCKDKKDVTAHTPGAEATEATAQTCTTCGYVIKAALGHKHNYATTWTTDEGGHWYACSGCAEKSSYAAHDFENDCDKDCSICGYTRETEHKFAEAWTSDATNHWHVCSACGLKQDEAAHEPGAEATATTAQTCTICGYEIAPALGSEETTGPTESTDATTPTVPTDKTDPEDGSFPWWIIIIVAVVAIGGVVAVIVIKKKK